MTNLYQRETKLPQWVQAELSRLRRRVRALEERVDDSPYVPGRDRVVVLRSADLFLESVGQPLTSDVVVRFITDPSLPQEGRIDVAIVEDSPEGLGKGWLSIRGTQPLILRVGASNAIYARPRRPLEDRYD